MNSKYTKIGIFFLTVALLMWFLYPRELFLAMLYESEDDLSLAENYYLKILEKKPYNKEAVFRLSNLYDRMAQPEKAEPYLQNLFNFRKTDWNVAEFFLEQKRNQGDLAGLQKLQIEVARRFKKNPQHQLGRVIELYELSIEMAIWKRDVNTAYVLLEELAEIAKDPSYYKYQLLELDYALKHTDKIIQKLTDNLKKKPDDFDSLEELVHVYIIAQRLPDALMLIDEGLKRNDKRVSFYDLRSLILEKQKNWRELARNIEKMIPLITDESSRYTKKLYLVNVLVKQNQNELAVAQLKELIPQAEMYPGSWRDIIYLLGDLHETELKIEQLEKYTQKHPEDLQAKQDYVEALLYEKKNLAVRDLYLSYVRSSGSEDFALNYAWALADSHKKDEAVSWLKEVRSFVRGERKIISALVVFLNDLKRSQEVINLLGSLHDLNNEERRILADSFLHLQQFEKALEQLQILFKTTPQVELALSIVSLQFQLGKKEEAKTALESVLNIAPHREAALLLVGKQMLFMGDAGRASRYLSEADQIHKDNPEVLFWWSQALEALDEPRSARRLLRRLNVVFQKNPPQTKEQKRIHLKTKALLSYDNLVSEKYLSWLALEPKFFDLRADYIDILIQNKKLELAEKQIEMIQRDFPEEKEALAAYRVRLAFAHRNWLQAMDDLELILSRKPSEWGYRRDLGYAAEQAGMWLRALREYEAVYRATGNEFKVLPTLRRLHAENDNRVLGQFEWTTFGGESFDRYTILLRQNVGERFRLELGTSLARYQSRFSAENNEALWAELKVTARLNSHFVFHPFIHFGKSPHRNVIGGGGEVEWRLPSQIVSRWGGRYHTLRNDLPSGFATGALLDQIYARFEIPFSSRLFSQVSYEFENTRLRNSLSAQTHRLESNLNWIFWDKPQLTLGYQMQFSRTSGNAAFFSSLPLLQETNSHYLTFSARHTFVDRFSTQVGFFIGEDFDRRLHFFEADIWGVRSRLEWRLKNWLDVEAGYEYGRETQLGVAGQSHSVFFSLSGHWF